MCNFGEVAHMLILYDFSEVEKYVNKGVFLQTFNFSEVLSLLYCGLTIVDSGLLIMFKISNKHQKL